MDKQVSNASKPIVDASKRWWNALDRHKLLQQDLNGASCEVANSENALGKLLAPEDMRIGECIGVWVRNANDKECLVNVTKIDVVSFKVTSRR